MDAVEKTLAVLDALAVRDDGVDRLADIAARAGVARSTAHRILQRLEFHHTPKHASWLNMVEIEIGVLRGQCLDRRIGERETLVAEVDAWQRQRNNAGARVQWKFTTQDARKKLGRAYPKTANTS